MSSERAERWYYWAIDTGEIMRSPRSENDDEVRGRCSGIPECCVKFFIEQRPFGETSHSYKEHTKRMDDMRERFEFQYIPCPDCLGAKRFVELKLCNESNCFCGQWEYRERAESKLKDISDYRKQKRRVRMSRKKRRGYA
jgi:hypothetical protein